MSPLDESMIRSELHQAVDVLDPLPPPFPAVLARGRRRRRTRRAVGGLVVAAGVAAAVVAVVVVVPGGRGGPGPQRIIPAVAPPPLRQYARHNGGDPVKHSRFSLDWIAGPTVSATGRYGAFVTDSDLVVAKVVDGRWTAQAEVSLNQGPPQFRLGVQPGPTLPDGTPTFVARTEGGDVAYAAGVAVHLAGGWRYAMFGPCGKGNCPAGSTQPSYLRMTHSGLVSQQDNCTPDCADGTDYLIRWHWDGARQRFIATSVTVQEP